MASAIEKCVEQQQQQQQEEQGKRDKGEILHNNNAVRTTTTTISTPKTFQPSQANYTEQLTVINRENYDSPIKLEHNNRGEVGGSPYQQQHLTAGGGTLNNNNNNNNSTQNNFNQKQQYSNAILYASNGENSHNPRQFPENTPEYSDSCSNKKIVTSEKEKEVNLDRRAQTSAERLQQPYDEQVQNTSVEKKYCDFIESDQNSNKIKQYSNQIATIKTIAPTTANISSSSVILQGESSSRLTVVSDCQPQQQQQQQLQNRIPQITQQQQQPLQTIRPTTTITTTAAVAASTMPKNNEPIKLVYPSQQATVVPSSSAVVSSAGTTILSMNNANRLTFTTTPQQTQQLQNGGTINLQQQQQQSNLMQSTTTSMGLVMTSAGGVKTIQHSQQQQAPGTQTLVISKNQANANNLQTMMPGMQIVNMRPGTPNTNQTQQKTVATVSPRVVIGAPHMVGARPGGNQAITLSALQNLPGQSGPTLLLKTENGQIQLLRMGSMPMGTPNIGNNQNQTIRLQTVPAQQTMTTSTGNIVVNSTMSTAPTQILTTQQTTMQPPIASVAPVPALTQQHTSQSQPLHQQQQNTTVVAQPAAPGPGNPNNTKEKCRKFLANLLELSSKEPKPVEKNVRVLIQELIDANVEPENFCDRLERLLNASPQPCLIGFLKKSLPLLRQSLVTKELVIEGIKPPPHSVAYPGSIMQTSSLTTSIPAQIRPVHINQHQTTTVGQTQVRMVTQATPHRPIGQTTITRHTAPIRIQGPNTVTGPRLLNSSSIAQIRPGNTTLTVQSPQVIHHQSNPPALHPVTNTSATISAGTPTQVRQVRAQAANRGVNVAVQNLQGRGTAVRATGAKNAQPKLTAAQIKQQQLLQQNHSVVNVAATTIANSNSLQQHHHVNNNQATTTIVTSAATMGAPPLKTMKAIQQQNFSHTLVTAAASSATNSSTMTMPAPAVASAKSMGKEKEKKAPPVSAAATASASSSFYQPSMSSSMYGDDDINDVAAMGGVNLAEESQKILGSTELIGTQIRSCKDEVFLHMPALQNKIRAIISKHNLDEPSNDVAVLLSHATQERLKNIVEKLAVIAEHRIDIIKVDPRYEMTKDVRGQIKFLEELDKAEQKRHEEQERELLMRAAKSRSKTEDPEQAKLKAKAKEMQRAEMEELRQRDANLTALQAIGPRKKPRLEVETGTTQAPGSSTGTSTGAINAQSLRPRIKRVNLKDMLFYLEQERETCRSPMLYKAYLK